MSPKRPVLIAVFVVIILIFMGSTHCSKNKAPKNYNIVLIVSDALRSDVLGCYGGDVSTPNIDGLAEKGVLFEKAYSTAPSTLPSSVSIFTGNYSGSYGKISRKSRRKNKRDRITIYVNENETLFAEALKNRSYDVLMELENQIAGFANNLQGFDRFRMIKKEEKRGNRLVENVTGIKPRMIKGKSGFKPSYSRMYSLLHYLLTVPGDQNFFVMKWFLDPHGPYRPQEKFKKKIAIDPATLPRDESLYTGGLKAVFQLYKENKLSKRELEYFKSLYKAEVESVDERVGYILKALEYRGFLDNTIVVFTSDHGEFFGEHGLLGHGQNHYEQVIHVPLIIAGPGIPKGKREQTMISNLDLMPTLKDLLDIEYDHNMQGKSYSTLFSGGKVSHRIQFFDRTSNVSGNTKNSALLMNGYKLIVTRKGSGRSFTLFNLSNDPSELKDVSSKNRLIVKKMIKKYLDFLKEINIRLSENIKNIDKNINFNKKWLEARKVLETLGYL